MAEKSAVAIFARRYWYDCKRILKSDSAFEL